MAVILGIIGGGQLGMMLTEAANKIPEKISKVIVLDPTENCPASIVGAEQIVADFKDERAIQELAEKADVLTYEIESGNSKVLKTLESKVIINPSPDTLKIIQDKYTQKLFLRQNELPVGDFIKIESKEELEYNLQKFGFPALLKIRRDAYDGRGNYKINNQSEIQNAINYFEGKPTYLEKFVDYKMEVSVIAARNTHGEIKTFPVVENIHEDNILKMTIAPARVPDKISEKAKEIAIKTMDVLKGAGVFGIEMFVTKNDSILINEIAPRVHNSGHHTLQSSKTSQFEQHLKAILGLDLGDTDLIYQTIMCNILGPKNFQGKYKPLKISQKNIFLKMYHKLESKPQRKMGHFNMVDFQNSETITNMIEKVEEINEELTLQPIDE
ncbi:MAG: 5-(carboxyamino)imidazole ribonucleotide synthase [Crenarchaeota archaeon]|nr:MAG: 5-(carboxyamino)imidazole ribonucleotide synthase [Thermoproteota archaeon]RDJ34151.1 MAG: 5-(carboxyamino)imidazole ribonucleotide synthase [Thermoproteota archaeon]RDJ36733.1 MAG: 5-(carboxyamino)imidazole ribonucleotide synthase [Thermoproteota archaeon]RDJ37733.1 MAG: 5-(carboxyamino)imidazole ribonucleotide synthase [Thermoproteota archaeon]